VSIVLVYALMIAVGLVTTPSPWRRRAGLALAWLAAATPLLMWRFGPEEDPIVRFVAGLGVGVALGRGWELASDPRPRTWKQRVWHTTTLFDSRTATPAPRAFLVREGLAATGYYALAGAGFWLAFYGAPAEPAVLHYGARWLGGLLLLYGAMDGLAAGFAFCYRLAGYALPKMHDVPIASRSLGEFWGERWNRPVSVWLRRACFMPLARRGHTGLGLLWAFTVSAFLHIYLTAIAIGLWPALVVGALFLLHGFLMTAERYMGVRRWPAWAGRTWFLVTMVGSAPLMIEPLLQAVFPGH
jgi:hypothetical protein